MSIINPGVRLNSLNVSQVWAKLERIDGKGSYNFLVNPEEIAWSHQAEFSSLPVLYTAQPLVSYKSSSSSLSLPKVLFWTKAHSGDLTDTLSALKAMTRPPAPGQQLPILKLTWGDLVAARLYLKAFSYREKQWRSGRVTQAEGNMEFLLSPEPAKAQYSAVPQAAKVSSSSSSSSSAAAASAKPTKLTDRERQEYRVKVVAKLKADQNLVRKFGIKDIGSVTVREDGQMIALLNTGFNQLFGSVSDVLGFDQIKPSHRELFK